MKRKDFLTELKKDFKVFFKLRDKRFDKFIALFLSIALVYSALPLFVSHSVADPSVYPVPTKPNKVVLRDNSQSDNVSTGVNNSDWYSASTGTQADPYIIRTGNELAYLATLVNNGNTFVGKYIKIVGSQNSEVAEYNENCLDLLSNCGILYQSSSTGIGYKTFADNNTSQYWTPIGNSTTNCFNGTIYADKNNDGTADSINIYNLTANLTSYSKNSYGLFGFLGQNASVEGLDFVDSQIYTTLASKNVGALAGYAKTGATIKNCKISAVTTGTTFEDTGDEANDRTVACIRRENSAINSLTSSANGTSYDYYYTPNFSSCTTQTNTILGGLVGVFENGSGTGTVTDCETNAVFKSSSKSGTGGIIGKIISGSVSVSNITTSTGVVFIGNYFEKAGGVIGQSVSTLSVDTVGISEENPFNVIMCGTMTCGGKDGGYGGILGVAGNSDDKSVTDVKNGYIKMTSKLSANGQNNIYSGAAVGLGLYAGTNFSTLALRIENIIVVDTLFTKYNDLKTYAISFGGVLGSIVYNSAANTYSNVFNNSYIRNCTVKNSTYYTDGFFGGIAGMASSSGTSAIKEITGCTVENVNVLFCRSVSQLLNSGTSSYYICGMIVASLGQGSMVSDCHVKNSSLKGIVNVYNTTTTAYNLYGGIIGLSYGSTISDCTSQCTIEIGSVKNGESVSGVNIGGIVGFATGSSSTIRTKVNNCGAIFTYDWLRTYTFTDGIPLTISGTNDMGANVGGIVGDVDSYTDISNCFSSGDINLESTSEGETYKKIAGGIVGTIANYNVVNTIENCYSSCTISGNKNDAMGGLIGLCTSPSTSVSLKDCRFEGQMLNPWAASIVYNYTTKFTCSGVTYDDRYSPNGACANTNSTLTDVISGVSVSQTNSFDSSTLNANALTYYNSAKASNVNLGGAPNVYNATSTTSAINGVAVSSNTYADNTVFLSSVTVGGITIPRRVKILSTSLPYDETNKFYSVSNTAQWEELQNYTKIGGAALGVMFKVGADFTTNTNSALGNAYYFDSINSADFNKEYQPFCADFDGCGNTITVGSTSISDTTSSTSYYAGLFGYIQSAYITYLKVKYTSDITISATKSAGGLVGYADTSRIVDVTVSTNNNTLSSNCSMTSGGIIGKAFNTPVSHSSFIGNFSGANLNVGGLVGTTQYSEPSYPVVADLANIRRKASLTFYTSKALDGSDVYGSRKYGNVTATSQLSNTLNSMYTGGIVGYLGNDCSISSTYSFGNVYGVNYVGGIAGVIENVDSSSDQFIKSCFVHGDVEAAYYNSAADRDAKINQIGGTNAGGIVGSVLNNTSSADSFYRFVNYTYFVGQITCPGAYGALTSCSTTIGSVSSKYFYYDQQVAGYIDVAANIKSSDGFGLSTAALRAVVWPTGGTIVKSNSFYPYMNISKTISSASGISHLASLKPSETSGVDYYNTTAVYNDYTFNNNISSDAFMSGSSVNVINNPTNVNVVHNHINDNSIESSSLFSDSGSNPISYSSSRYTTNTISDYGFYDIFANYTVDGFTFSIRERITNMNLVSEDENAVGGTEENPFLIRNVNELVDFRVYVNGGGKTNGTYFKLGMDGTFEDYYTDDDGYWTYDLGQTYSKWTANDEWTPIGTGVYKFSGYLDGNGCRIANLTPKLISESILSVNHIYGGLFGITVGASIHDLSLTTAEATLTNNSATNWYVGTLCAQAGDGTTIDSIDVDSNLNWNFSTYTKNYFGLGGVVGEAEGNVKVTNTLSDFKSDFIKNSGYSYTDQRLGISAIVGLFRYDGQVTFENNVSYCNITNQIANKALNIRTSIGGILGLSLSASKFTFDNCAVFGNIDSFCGAVGGLVGQLAEDTTSKFNNCFSNAEIYDSHPETGSVEGVGGFVGINRGPANFTNCLFSGTVKLRTKTSASGSYNSETYGQVGGFVGYSNFSVTLSNIAFDSAKNYDILACGNPNYMNSYTKKYGSDLIDANGYYVIGTTPAKDIVTVSNTDGYTFGSSVANEKASHIINANSFALSLVRQDNPDALQNDIAWNFNRMLATGAFVNYGTKYNNKDITLTASDDTNVAISPSKRRVAAKTTDTDNTVTVKAVCLDENGIDLFEGYGTSYTFYPSILSNGRSDASYFASEGTNGVYDIFNADQLMGLHSVVTLENDALNATVFTAGTSYVANILRDIDFAVSSLVSDTTLPSLYSTDIIGTSTNAFVGTLNGNEHIIKNLARTTDDVSGLFAYLNGAKLNSIGIANSYFSSTADTNIGSFAAVASATTFKECFSSATLFTSATSVASTNIGGIVGVSQANNYNRCFFTGSLTDKPISTTAYNSVDVTGTYYVGGFAGVDNNANASILTNCYSSTYINCATANGIGLVFGHGNTAPSFSGCSVDYNSSSDGCKVISNINVNGISTTPKTDDLYPSYWDSDNDYETLARIAVSYNGSASSLSNASVDYTDSGFSKDNYLDVEMVAGTAALPFYTITGGSKITRTNSGIGSALVTYGNASRMIIFSLQCWYDKFDTDENGNKTYTIKTASELIELARLVANGDDSSIIGHEHTTKGTNTSADNQFAGDTIVLGGNITFDEDEILEMIGTSSKPFAGTFDGNGFAITNANFETTDGMAGMFGYVTSGAQISHVMLEGESTVNIKDNNSSGNAYVGLVVANNQNGNITNCINGANATVANSTNGTAYIGGIVGYNGANLEYCYNMGRIIASYDSDAYIAGIAGKNASTISNCYNTGIMDAFYNPVDTEFNSKTYTSGICSSNTGAISQCYNAALMRYSVEGKHNPIALGSGTVANCYADGQIYRLNYDFSEGEQDGVTYKTTVDLSSGILPSGFDSSVWTCVNGYLPQLSSFANASATYNSEKLSSSVSALASVLTSNEGTAMVDEFNVITFNYGTTAIAVVEDNGNSATFVRRNPTNSTTLTVKKKGAALLYLQYSIGDAVYSRTLYFVNEEAFTVRYMIDFSELVGDSSESVQRTTQYYDDDNNLLNYQGGSSTKINTFSTNGVVFASNGRIGAGSAGNPYLINTYEDLDAFATFINTGGQKKYYFKLINNISYPSSRIYTPIGTATNPFNGIFNGNGYTISGISNNVNAQYTGLFGYASSHSTISLVALENCQFTSTYSGDSYWLGTLAGYSDGIVSNCYTKSSANAYNGANKIYAGGLVGELGANANLMGCYTRGYNITGNTYAALVSFVTDDTPEYYGGTLVGKNSGNMIGSYHTVYYYTPVIASGMLEPYGVLVGWNAEGTLTDVYYDNEFVSRTDLYCVKWEGTTSKYHGTMTSNGNEFAKTDAQMKTTETGGATNGTANDSMALILSQSIYLGTYSMSQLHYHSAFNTSEYSRYSNDGYPMLTAFDLLQYDFKSFDNSNFIVNAQNIDSSEAKIMNALCSYEYYDFPIFADITIKEILQFNVLSLPTNYSFNLSAVGYGNLESNGDDQKWVVVNGHYTNRNDLTHHTETVKGESVIYDDYGSGMMDYTATYGHVSIPMSASGILPENCSSMYVYVSLSKSSSVKDYWGVYHTWDSSSLGDEVEEVVNDGE